jgi:peptidoglycan/LPS O-acetylase OafA/YrhL
LAAISWIPRGIAQAVARQSLGIYLVHLCILYGSVWNTGLRQWLGPTLDPLHTLLWIGAMLAAMTLLAWGGHRIKSKAKVQELKALPLVLAKE